ncbi:MAG: thiamine diphosphokinase [Peptococcaceae bacterium]|nr:thiamine diphosphokinase [Peptococcaceae bacterium]
MRCVIIANGSMDNYVWGRHEVTSYDLRICADGGARHFLGMELVPDAIIGDLDSLDPVIEEFFIAKGVKFVKFPPQKDSTDMELAVEYALAQGAKEIALLGALGRRLDHSLANILLLVALAKRGVLARIIDEHNEVRVCHESTTIEGRAGELLSVIPLSEKVEQISLEGVKYQLKDATMRLGSSLGVSNEFIASTATITFAAGILLLIKSKD